VLDEQLAIASEIATAITIRRVPIELEPATISGSETDTSAN